MASRQVDTTDFDSDKIKYFTSIAPGELREQVKQMKRVIAGDPGKRAATRASLLISDHICKCTNMF